MNLRTLIRQRRKALGLTQRELGKALGIHGQFISNIERGVAPLPRSQYRKLARALRVPLLSIIRADIKDYRLEIRKEFNL
jgi:transcriptional regulator with XRE-family HTH domain